MPRVEFLQGDNTRFSTATKMMLMRMSFGKKHIKNPFFFLKHSQQHVLPQMVFPPRIFLTPISHSCCMPFHDPNVRVVSCLTSSGKHLCCRVKERGQSSPTTWESYFILFKLTFQIYFSLFNFAAHTARCHCCCDYPNKWVFIWGDWHYKCTLPLMCFGRKTYFTQLM